MTLIQSGIVLRYAESTDIDPIALLTLVAMASFCKKPADDETPSCFASVPTIATRSHLGVTTVKEALKRLVELGVVSHDGKRGKTNEYRMDILTWSADDHNARACARCGR
ncbi:helix-turn-helix domain-containing protein, partial [Phytoactinopolyspora endophytica]|uniref:helix-turn-helix domain-containing protein n=1 Tax=Phytoactinopolyspora endophytica TaxID=1642495 RepID=UPI0013EC7896